MTVIEKIKEELDKVWNGEMVTVQIHRHDPLTFSFTNLNPIQPETTATFLTLSPERIALLVEYYEAAEAHLQYGKSCARVDKARAALEKEGD